MADIKKHVDICAPLLVLPQLLYLEIKSLITLQTICIKEGGKMQSPKCAEEISWLRLFSLGNIFEAIVQPLKEPLSSFNREISSDLTSFQSLCSDKYMLLLPEHAGLKLGHQNIKIRISLLLSPCGRCAHKVIICAIRRLTAE